MVFIINRRDFVKYNTITDFDVRYTTFSNLKSELLGVTLWHVRLSDTLHRVKVLVHDDHLATAYIDLTNFLNGSIGRAGTNSLFRRWAAFTPHVGEVNNIRVDMHYPAFLRCVEANVWRLSDSVFEVSLRLSLECGVVPRGRYVVVFDIENTKTEKYVDSILTPKEGLWLGWGR